MSYELYQQYIENRSQKEIRQKFIESVDKENRKSYHFEPGDGEFEITLFIEVCGDDDYSGFSVYAEDFLEDHPNVSSPMECFYCCFDYEKDIADNQSYNKLLSYLKRNGFVHDEESDVIFE